MTEKLKFGDKGTEKWFGGPMTLEFIKNVYSGDARALYRNTLAAIDRLEGLPEEHPFRKAELKKLEDFLTKIHRG